MPYWAEIDDNNVVVRVTPCDADDDADGTLHAPAFLTDVLPTTEAGHVGNWKRTYYDTPGHTYAGIGFVWNPETDDFDPPDPEVNMDQVRLAAVENFVAAQEELNAALVDEDVYHWDAIDAIAARLPEE